MKAYERIKVLRKTILHMTQENFAREINISRSNLGNIETGKIGLTDRVIADVCRTFQVRRAWVVSGAGNVFEDEGTLAEREIRRVCSLLTDENRKYVASYMRHVLECQERNESPYGAKRDHCAPSAGDEAAAAVAETASEDTTRDSETGANAVEQADAEASD